jgi:hypothetical protein
MKRASQQQPVGVPPHARLIIGLVSHFENVSKRVSECVHW